MRNAELFLNKLYRYIVWGSPCPKSLRALAWQSFELILIITRLLSIDYIDRKYQKINFELQVQHY